MTDLCDEELGDSLRQFAFLTGQNHLQHVTVQFLHDDKDPLRGFKHALQVDNAGMMQILWTDVTDVTRLKGRALGVRLIPVIWPPRSSAGSLVWLETSFCQ